MRKRILAAIIVLGHTVGLVAESQVGKIHGVGGVSPSGAATYQIAIDLPTDEFGYSPDVQLIYNSHTCNGVLGYGWNLSGFSAISRCGSTIYYDGSADIVGMTSSGNFSLDGKRLVLYSERTYSPEDDPTTKVVSSFDGFDVYKKDGSVLEYGVSDDSRIGITNSPWLWLLKSSTDQRGHIITYTYGGFPLENKFYLSRIDYDYNKSVRFNYETRPDITNRWFAGQSVPSVYRLISVSTYVQGTKMKEYSFSYSYDGYFSKLTSIQLYGQNGAYYNPTIISYTGSSQEYKEYAPLSSNKSQGRVFYGDFDGDGRMDFISYSSSQNVVSVYKATSNWNELSFSHIGNISISNNTQDVYVSDIDGNGHQNIVIVDANGATGHHTYYAIENGTLVNKGSFNIDYGTFLYGDYTGNGKTEYLNMYNKKVYDNTGTIIADAANINWNDVYDRWRMDFIPSTKTLQDFNGDKKDDILIVGNDGLKVYELKDGNVTEVTSFATSAITNASSISCGDFNGDGYTDILARRIGQCDIYMSTGTSFIATSYSFNISINVPVMVGEFNGDGRADLFHLGFESGEYRFVTEVFNGSGFTKYSTSAPVHPGMNGGTNLFDKYSTIADFDGDGLTEFGCFYYNDKAIIKHFNNSQNLLVSDITDGLGMCTHFSYAPSSNTQACIHSSSSFQYPVSHLSQPIWLACTITIGESYGFNRDVTNYTYKNPMVHSQGKGFLGYEEIITQDTRETRTSHYSIYPTYDYPYLSFQERKTQIGENLISRSYYTESARILSSTRPYRFVPYNNIAYYTDYVTNTSRQVFTNIDDYGNTTSLNTFYSDNFTETVQSNYYNVTNSQWIIGLPTMVTRTQSNSQGSWSQKQEFSYNDRNLLNNIRKYEGNMEQPVQTDIFTYNHLGDIITHSVRYSDLYTPLTTYYTYNRCKLARIVDPYLQVTEYSYDNFHRLTGISQSSGLTTTYTYDDMGRISQEATNDGTSFTVSYSLDDSRYASVWRRMEQHSDGSISKTWYDIFNREVGSSITDYQGEELITERIYDNCGHIYSESLPFKDDNHQGGYYRNYDDYGRVTEVHHWEGGTDEYTYSGNSITQTKDGVTTTMTYDDRGNLVQVSDGAGDIIYTLRPDGQPLSVEALGVTTSFCYDGFGRRTSITDPCGGCRTYTYNDLGLLSEITDADGRALTISYDGKGRKTAEQRPEFSTNYVYDANNRLQSISSTNGTGQVFAYDSLGRMSTQKDLLPDGKYLLRAYNYQNGNVSSVSYSNQSTSLGTETRSYNNGILTSIYFGQKHVWSLLGEDNHGLRTAEQSGPVQRTFSYNEAGAIQSISMNKSSTTLQSLTFGIDAATGNMSWRKDAKRNLTENFTYDELNRLTSYAGNSMEYDNRGNITIKEDANLYLSYGNSDHPYAVTSLAGSASPDLFHYSDQQISYNSFECPDTLVDGGVTTSFTYNAAGERVMMNAHHEDVPTRYYVNNIYEEEQVNGETVYRLYLGGDAYSAPAVYVHNGSIGQMYYLGRDHLGSITHIANEDGTLLHEFSYDAWGGLRNPSNMEVYTVGQEPSLFLGRGYCGHEHLPWCGLINMNARLYDPVLGSFLSPDPYVQAPENSQNYNRYSYCLNNPLKYTDPSGEILWLVIGGALIGGAVNLGMKASNGQINGWSDAFAAFSIGAMAGGIGAATGGAAFAAAGGAAGGVGGFLAGAAGGMAGTAVSAPIQSFGNNMYFGDPLMSSGEYLGSVLISGALGGVLNGWTAIRNGRRFLNGEIKQMPQWGLPANTEVATQMRGIDHPYSRSTSIKQAAPEDIVSQSMQNTEFPVGSGTNSVYYGADGKGVIRYVGITERMPEIRFEEHLGSLSTRANLRYFSIPNSFGLSRIQARIIEQNLINSYGIGRNGGQLYNKINSISPRYWNRWGITINF